LKNRSRRKSGLKDNKFQPGKFFGVVEGFYRRPYTFNQRLDLIAFLSDIGLNTYVYGPKADSYHRKYWQKPYPNKLLKRFEKLSDFSKKYSVYFNYALSPMAKPDVAKIIKKIASMVKLGIKHFSLFYDDITVPLTRDTAETQVKTANELLEFLKTKIPRPALFFCPTQYRGFKETEYILAVSKKLHKHIKIFWTGKRVVSKRITEKDINRITKILNRQPLIWDNLFANDYIPGTILRFPYRYRDPEIIKKVSGILINPMNQYKQSKPLIYTAAKFFKEPTKYIPRKAWQEAKR
jgi:hyaluronoglucosaminidase